jgi:hypothetical protein
MLPFKKLQEGSMSMPVEYQKRESDKDSDGYDMLESAAEDLISAIHSKNIKAVCSALRAAHELCDLEPHSEAPHDQGE